MKGVIHASGFDDCFLASRSCVMVECAGIIVLDQELVG